MAILAAVSLHHNKIKLKNETSLQEVKQDNFGDLGKFRLQIQCVDADSLEKFTSANIKGVNNQYIPGDELKIVFSRLEFTPVASCKAQIAVLRA